MNERISVLIGALIALPVAKRIGSKSTSEEYLSALDDNIKIEIDFRYAYSDSDIKGYGSWSGFQSSINEAIYVFRELINNQELNRKLQQLNQNIGDNWDDAENEVFNEVHDILGGIGMHNYNDVLADYPYFMETPGDLRGMVCPDEVDSAETSKIIDYQHEDYELIETKTIKFTFSSKNNPNRIPELLYLNLEKAYASCRDILLMAMAIHNMHSPGEITDYSRWENGFIVSTDKNLPLIDSLISTKIRRY